MSLPTETSTRIVKLLPGVKQQPLRVSLLTIDLAHEHVPYEAVSYTWGTSTDQSQIYVEGKIHSIRVNLHSCLLRLRLLSAPRWLWIDCLSIAQTDLAEKSQQVRMIGNIFTSAEVVLIWVGEHSDESEKLFRPWPDLVSNNPATKKSVMSYWTVSNHRLRQRSMVHRANMWCFFFSRPYWKRTWVVQEIAVAQRMVVHCGQDSMDWTRLITARFGLHRWKQVGTFDGICLPNDDHVDILPSLHKQSHHARLNLRNALHRIEALYQARSCRVPIKNDDGGILVLINKHKATFCSDRRDYVYALRSMERVYQGQPEIPVDYTKSLAQVMVTLYQFRCVNSPRTDRIPLDLISTMRIPSPETVMLALSLNFDECIEFVNAIRSILKDREVCERDRAVWTTILKRLKDAGFEFDGDLAKMRVYWQKRVLWHAKKFLEGVEPAGD